MTTPTGPGDRGQPGSPEPTHALTPDERERLLDRAPWWWGDHGLTWRDCDLTPGYRERLLRWARAPNWWDREDLTPEARERSLRFVLGRGAALAQLTRALAEREARLQELDPHSRAQSALEQARAQYALEDFSGRPQAAAWWVRHLRELERRAAVHYSPPSGHTPCSHHQLRGGPPASVHEDCTIGRGGRGEAPISTAHPFVGGSHPLNSSSDIRSMSVRLIPAVRRRVRSPT